MATNPKLQNRKPYILTRKTHEGIDENGNRREYQPGETVMLTENQFKAFADRFTTPNVFRARQGAIQAQIEEASPDNSPEDAILHGNTTDPKPSGSDPKPPHLPERTSGGVQQPTPGSGVDPNHTAEKPVDQRDATPPKEAPASAVGAPTKK